MSTLTIRDLDDATNHRLRDKAAQSGRSPEAEAREILVRAVAGEPASGLAGRINQRFAKYGGVELEIVRQPSPRPIPFSDWTDDRER